MQTPHILIVEDELVTRNTLKSIFEAEGYDVFEATDGAEMHQILSEYDINLVIMDITMPNMDGLEALKAIRGKDGNANVVMCSAMGQESMVMDAVRSGAKDFIVKPFKPDRVLKTVTSILGAP